MIQRVVGLYTRLDERYPRYARVARFLVSGGTSTGVDLVLLYLFTEILGVWYLASATAAFMLAFFVSFTLQKFWTFQDYSRDVPGQASAYLVIAICNLGLNTALVYALVEYTHIHYLVAQIMVSIGIACESFFLYRRFIFHTHSS